jgi:hypothetical protein
VVPQASARSGLVKDLHDLGAPGCQQTRDCRPSAFSPATLHAGIGPQGVRPGEAGDRRADRDRAGTDDQLVVGGQFLGAVSRGDEELAGGDVDPARGGVQPQVHPGGFQVGGRPVGEVAPVGTSPER